MIETLKNLIMKEDTLKDFNADSLRKKQIDISVKLILQELKKIQELATTQNTIGSTSLNYMFENIGDQLIEDIIGELKARGFEVSQSMGKSSKIILSWKQQDDKNINQQKEGEDEKERKEVGKESEN